MTAMRFPVTAGREAGRRLVMSIGKSTTRTMAGMIRGMAAMARGNA
jgi:hypothetical protein